MCLIFRIILAWADVAATINPGAVLIDHVVPYLSARQQLAFLQSSALSIHWRAPAYDIQPLRLCMCCSYTVIACISAVSLQGSNGCLIRLWTVSVSFQPTTDLDMSKKITSPFLPLGLKPFHLIVWWNIHLQRRTYFSSRGNCRLRKWKETFAHWETVSLNTGHTVPCAGPRVQW